MEERLHGMQEVMGSNPTISTMICYNHTAERRNEEYMRRKDREVTEMEKIRDIIELCKTCHVAMIDSGTPYVIPLSFGYELAGNVLTLYFHSAKEGRKIDILHNNNSVCFEMCYGGKPAMAAETPCNSGYYFSCIHGFGNVTFVSDSDEKCRALSLLMKRQAGLDISFTAAQAESVCVYKIVSTDFTGKKKSE